MPETRDTPAARPRTAESRLPMDKLAAILAVVITLAGSIGSYYALRQEVTDTQTSNAEKHASYEARIKALESGASDTHAALEVLKDRSEQSLEWQKALDSKLDQLIQRKH